MRVIVLGCGISGLAAAIESVNQGYEVTLLSNYPSERAQSVMAAGGINAVTEDAADDSAKIHALDTIRAGCNIEPGASVLAMCERAGEHLTWLENMGVVFSRDESGRIRQRAFGGQSRIRTAFAGASTGKQIVTALVQKCREFEIHGRVTRVTGLHFHSALIKAGECYGVLMCNELTGELRAFYADAVIMAVGGQNKLFGKTTGTQHCDGYAAARLFTQGVKLRNLEFVQYHPTTIETSHKRMLISEAARGEGGRLYYLEGEKRRYFMEELYGPEGNLMPRDIVARCIYNAPSKVYLDVSFLGDALIKDRLIEIYELCREYINLDITRESIPVYPSVHFFMGGLLVDDDHMTNIRRLYAVGECASKYHGANRLGGNSLLAAVHSGRTAAEKLSKMGDASCDEEEWNTYIEHERELINAIEACESHFPIAPVLDEIAGIMDRNLGIRRTEEMLQEGIEALDFYIDAVSKLHTDPTVSVYEVYRINYLLILAKAIMLSALERRESRGAHYRDDYPETMEAYRGSSVAEYVNGQIRIDYIPGDEVPYEG